MKFFSLYKWSLFLATILLYTSASAQIAPEENIISSKKSNDGRFNFIKFDLSKRGQLRNETQPDRIKRIFGLGAKHSFVQNVAANNNPNFKTDIQGLDHVRYNQFFNGIKVEHGVITLHRKNGELNIVTGDYLNIDENFSTAPSISENSALNNAIAFDGANKYSWQDNSFTNPLVKGLPKGELVICRNFIEESNSISSSPKMELAYKFAIYATEPLRYDNIYVSARTGNIILVDPIIKHVDGTAATRYSGSRTIATTQLTGTSYVLKDSGSNYNIATYNMKRGSSYSIAANFSDSDNNWTAAEYNNSNYDNAAMDAHWGAMMTFDYWRTVHNRNSFDNKGGKINSYVHYGSLYANAFWDGYVMTYGDGNGTTMFPLTSVDICGHEIGHAVCQYTANLIYQNESGAMNEGFSDIWGACIKKYADATKNIWLLGDEISSTASPIRSMINPKSKGQPDTYKGTNWYTGTGDNGGVHTNSGVLNYWFYLLTEGKAGTNDKGIAYNVSGIGITKAAQIAYRAENLYLYPAAVYADTRIFTIQAAEDLFGVGSNEVIQTTEAWKAVGLNDVLARPDSVRAAIVSSNIVVSWRFNNFQTVNGFKVERAVNGSSVFTTIATVPTSIRSYTDTGFVNNSINQYRVRAYRDTLNSDYSDVVSVAVGNAPLIMINGSYTTCGATFLDPGGLGNYTNGSYVTTLRPATVGNNLKVVFSQFNTGYDYLYVYNGPTTSSPIIGIYTGITLPPVLQSTAPGGELTFSFNAYNANNLPGWQAYVSCFRPVPAPTNLTFFSDSLKDVHLTWTDNATDETHFVVERSLNDSLHYLPLINVPASTTSYVDTAAPDNSYLYYRVRAFRDSVSSPYSNRVFVVNGNIYIMQNGSLTTCGVTFLDPGGQGNYNSGNYSVTVRPATVGNNLRVVFNQFNVYPYDYLYIYNGTTISAATLLGTYSGTNLPPALQSTAPGGELTFVFNPYYSNAYPGWQAYISCYKPVAAPTNLTVYADSIKDLHLAWTDNANDETHYVVERSLNDSLHYVSLGNLPANTTTYVDTSAPDNSFNYYRVRAYRDSVGSVYSKEVSIINGNFYVMQNATINTCGITFLDPGGLSDYGNSISYTTTFTPPAGGNKMKVVFSKFNTESYYDRLEIYNGPTTSSPLLGSFSGTTLPPVYESTSANGELTFQFFANSSVTYPGWQAYVSCFKPVPKPTGLKAIADSLQKIKLTWKDNANDETKYVVERSVNAPSNYTAIAQLPANTIQYFDTAAPANNFFYYRVRAYRDTLPSPYSDTASIGYGNAPFLMKDSTLFTCDKVFLDPGGVDLIPSNFYYNIRTTFKPSVTGNNVKVVFSKFRINGYFYVYNGSSTSSPQIGYYNSNNTTLPVFDGTNAEGSLTFVYQGYSYGDTGWIAQVNCYKPVTKPSGLKAVADTSQRIRLTWSDNANDETRYVVERSANAPSKYVPIAQLPANANQYIDSAPLPNSLLYYRVRAYRDTMGSFYSDTAIAAFGNAPFLMKDSTLITCDKVFMDPSGTDVLPQNVYYNFRTTFKPSVAGNNIKVVFSKFKLNGYLYVYNGSSTSSPQIGYYSGSNTIIPTFDGTNPEGSLTFVYQGYSYGDSGWVAQVSCYKPVAKPTGVTAVSDTSQRIRVSWTDNANDETKYVVERSVNAPSQYKLIAQLPANTNQYTDSAAPANSFIYYRIKAYRDTLGSFYSDTAKISFGNAPYLMKDSTLITCDKVFMDPSGTDILPSNVYYNFRTTFKPSVAGNNVKVVFSKFRLNGSLYVYNGSSTSSPQIGYYNGTVIPSFDGLNPEGSLTFVYQGYSYGDSGWVAQVSCYKPVPRPTGVTAIPDTSQRIKISWTDNANDETKYVVERSVNAPSLFTPIANLSPNTNVYTDSSAPANSLLNYRIRAYRDTVASLYSDTAKLSFGNAPFLMKDSTLITCDKVFMDPSGADVLPVNAYYNLRTTFKPAIPGNVIKVVFSKIRLNNSMAVYNGSSTSSPLIGYISGSPATPVVYEGSGTEGSLTFYYSTYSYGDSGWVAQVTCYKPVPKPGFLSAFTDTLKYVHLNWSDNANDETGYVVERSVNDSLHFSLLTNLAANTTSYIDNTAPDNTYMFYRVKAVRDTTGSPYTNSVAVSVGNFYVMQNGTVNGCGTIFLDPGGFGNYGNYANYTTTFTPSETGKKIKVVFSEFSTESCCDALRVYNGPNTSYPLIASYGGTSIPAALQSSATNGELTFVFTSDGSAVGSGWLASISCIKINDTLNTCSTNSSDINTLTSNLTGTTYQWQKFNGTTFVNIFNDVNTSGTSTVFLAIKNAALTVFEKFRCVVNGNFSREFVIIKGTRWTGKISTDWNNPLNWSCGTVPTSTTDILIEAGMINSPLLKNNTECRSLRIMPGAKLDIAPGINLFVRH